MSCSTRRLSIRFLCVVLMILFLSGCPSLEREAKKRPSPSGDNIRGPRRKVPDVVGMTQSAAEVAIHKAKLSVGTVTETHSMEVPQGIVIEQSPAAEMRVSLPASVDITVSLGPLVWARTYAGIIGESGNCILETAEGGFIISGAQHSIDSNKRNASLIKTDATGAILWSRIYVGVNDDYGDSVQRTSDGGYIITGRSRVVADNTYDVLLIKTDSLGNEQWFKRYGGDDVDWASCAQETSDGGFIFVGNTYSFSDGDSDIYLVKTDDQGNEEWVKIIGNGDYQFGNCVVEMHDGGFVITGNTYYSYYDIVEGSVHDCDVYLVKTDSLGNEEWSKTFGGLHRDYGEWLQLTSDGGIVISGRSASYGVDKYDYRAYLLKTDLSGNELWMSTFPGATKYYCEYTVHETSGSGYILTGSTPHYGAGSYDVQLIKTDYSGNELWMQTYGGTDFETGWAAIGTSDGGLVIAGATSSFEIAHSSDTIYLIKTDAIGNAPSVPEPTLAP